MHNSTTKLLLHVSREQFRETQKTDHNNPGFFQEQVYDAIFILPSTAQSHTAF
ncbi:hypothetical protein SAMN05880574_11424 [Chryseobacterium sp. RU37D]|nr:hypothetical protein SAMN05880574_11424 [Chryseobacterium sp. RU37D]